MQNLASFFKPTLKRFGSTLLGVLENKIKKKIMLFMLLFNVSIIVILKLVSTSENFLSLISILENTNITYLNKSSLASSIIFTCVKGS